MLLILSVIFPEFIYAIAPLLLLPFLDTHMANIINWWLFFNQYAFLHSHITDHSSLIQLQSRTILCFVDFQQCLLIKQKKKKLNRQWQPPVIEIQHTSLEFFCHFCYDSRKQITTADSSFLGPFLTAIHDPTKGLRYAIFRHRCSPPNRARIGSDQQLPNRQI